MDVVILVLVTMLLYSIVFTLSLLCRKHDYFSRLRFKKAVQIILSDIYDGGGGGAGGIDVTHFSEIFKHTGL